MTKKETILAFSLGAIGYPLVELAYRRRTHWTMALAGGAAFTAIYRVHQRREAFFKRCLKAMAWVTGIELVTGLMVNRLLKWKVWDYSHSPLNLWGQVCLGFSLYWMGLSALLSPLCRGLGRRLAR